METTILKTQELIESQIRRKNIKLKGEKHTEYQKSYYSTNEFIQGYLNLFNLNNCQEALTVTSSGDHIFNLITKGVYNIDTFDTNRLSEYIAIGLKRAMIMRYSYQEYISLNARINSPFEVISKEEARDIVHELLPFMEKNHRIFWERIIDFEYKMQKEYNTEFDIFSLLCFSFTPIRLLKKYNNFMSSEFEYNKLKKGLKKANLSFAYSNAIDLQKTFNGKKYDLILLSNILDYFNYIYGSNWDYEKLNDYIKTLETISKRNAIIFLNYIYSLERCIWFSDRDKYLGGYQLDKYVGNFKICQASSVYHANLKDEKVHLLNLEDCLCNDGIFLKRVKK